MSSERTEFAEASSKSGNVSLKGHDTYNCNKLYSYNLQLTVTTVTHRLRQNMVRTKSVTDVLTMF